ncbi:hypothetical protein TEA_017220 [Camellia sinensis var. sinensis]|uniref:Serine-threonine/tyrosine-protein kinase catalytic domain-containing protein n=1 Tax=Camellia sinensis var. sinensis TaxID=542762 RepID=A0A4S4DNY5_CAMSN|nr:hypothetical protein TEA_017220 [Camellia sinensis var. sinensis]
MGNVEQCSSGILSCYAEAVLANYRLTSPIAQHKNVEQVTGACMKPPSLCIVTEFMSGRSVYDYLHKQKGTFKLPSLLRVAIDKSRDVYRTQALRSQGDEGEDRHGEIMVDFFWSLDGDNTKVRVHNFGVNLSPLTQALRSQGDEGEDRHGEIMVDFFWSLDGDNTKVRVHNFGVNLSPLYVIGY